MQETIAEYLYLVSLSIIPHQHQVAEVEVVDEVDHQVHQHVKSQKLVAKVVYTSKNLEYHVNEDTFEIAVLLAPEQTK